ncbi:O-antigen ligase family protein [Chryseobacterium sp. WX]|uniref:O-antigen ligase family protein n=1 Tax=Chryseobacterium sp. WX TaxID=3031803 RepID=UPI00240A6FD2|nr:O-antigen ligase family protein [Chryseobacterium sp. WX]WFB69726.1 O-antigen ligase family protein [Chryseobacterium sp. WX]
MNIIVFLIIFSLSLGSFGGSFQPTRLLLLFLPFLLVKSTKGSHLHYNNTITFGLFTYFVWITYGLISLFWSPDPQIGLTNEIVVMTTSMSSLLFFPLFLKDNDATLKLIRNAWIYGLALTLPIAIYEIVTMNHFSYDDERLIGGIGIYAPYASVFFGNYNNYCVFICLCLPMVLWGIIEKGKKALKIFYLVVLGISVLIIFVNTNRTSMIIIVIYLLSQIRLNYKNLSFIALILLLFYFSYTFLPDPLVQNIEILFKDRVNVDYSNDESGSVRMYNFIAGIGFLIDSYGAGVGAGGYEYYMERSEYYKGIVNPHNFFLEIFAQYGIVIFSLFIIWLVKILIGFKKSVMLSSNVKRLLYTSVLVIPIIGIINSDSLGNTYWWLYLTSLAIISSVGGKKMLKSYGK